MLGDNPAALGAAFCRTRSQPKACEAGKMRLCRHLLSGSHRTRTLRSFWLLVVEAVRGLKGQVLRD